MESEAFLHIDLSVIMNYCGNNQGVWVIRIRRLLGGVGVRFLTTLGVGVKFFVRLRKSNWIIFYITHLSWEFVIKCTLSFETFVETEISCWAPRFPFTRNCYKVVNSQTSFT